MSALETTLGSLQHAAGGVRTGAGTVPDRAGRRGRAHPGRRLRGRDRQPARTAPAGPRATTGGAAPRCATPLPDVGRSIRAPQRERLGAVRRRGPPANHTASIAQTVVIPAGTASLTYWYRNSQVSSPFTATLQVRVDGNTVQTHTEASTPQSSYSQQTVDLSAFANGASHTISFNFANGDAGTNRMIVDDVSLNHTPPTTAQPTVTSTVPASPATTTTPQVIGRPRPARRSRSTPTAPARARRWARARRRTSRVPGSPRRCRRTRRPRSSRRRPRADRRPRPARRPRSPTPTTRPPRPGDAHEHDTGLAGSEHHAGGEGHRRGRVRR